MWYPYTFKLAYAENNEFELQVHTEWTCQEFIEKVTAMARLIYPTISINDTMHITESWNQSRDPGYNQMPSEENHPIPSIQQKIGDRYQSQYYNNLHFYIYFQGQCQDLLRCQLNGQPRTIEQVEVNMEYYRTIWEQEVRDTHILSHAFSPAPVPGFPELSYRTPTGSNSNFGREHSDRTADLSWTSMRSPYSGGIMPASSVAVSLDDMLAEQTNNQLSRTNLIPDFDAEHNNDEEDFNQISNSIYNTLHNRSPEFYVNSRATNDHHYPNIPILPLNRMLGHINIIPNIDDELDTELEPNGITDDDIMYCVPGDCCICFTENIQCHPLQRCAHSVCSTCYVGVFTRISGEIDLRCPMCRVNNSFSRNVYNLLSISNV
jgi:hypothetical protein